MKIHQAGKLLFSGAATEYWACSSAAATFMFSKSVLEKKHFCFIPNGIETEHFRFQELQRKQTRKELGISNAFVVWHVGRLCEQKNQMFLLEVFSEIWKRQPASQLILLGEGAMEEALQARAKELGVESQVHFLGVTNQVPRVLWAMDAFVFPSLFEGLGIVAIEAQAAGLPVFCSEYIPEEAHVTPDFYKCSLQDAPSKWAVQILSITELKRDRNKGADQVRAAGFEIADVARTIEAAYWG